MLKESFRKIPETAKCVFKGVLFEVWQWEQILFDGTSTTFEAIRRNNTVNILAITEGRKIIINYEEQPGDIFKITLPCGQTNDDETNLEAAKRELLEETGYVSHSWESWKLVDVLESRKIEWNAEYFIARDCQLVGQQNVDPGEKIEVKLVSFEEFLEITQNEKFPLRELSTIVRQILDSENVAEEKEKFRKFLFEEK